MDEHELIGKLICLNQFHRRVVEKSVGTTGLHQAQHRLLMCLARDEFGSQVELAKKMRVTPATIAVSLKNLERDGYIVRQAKESDNRFNNIELSEKGKRIVDDSRDIFHQIDEKMFGSLTDDEKETLANLLDKLYKNLSEL